MRGIRWIELVEIQQRAIRACGRDNDGAPTRPDDVLRLADEVLRAWDQLTPATIPRTVTWIDVVELQANALEGVACAQDVLRLAREIHRCWDCLYPLALRPAQARVDDLEWRFAGASSSAARPPAMRLIRRAVKDTTVRLRSIALAFRRVVAV